MKLKDRLQKTKMVKEITDEPEKKEQGDFLLSDIFADSKEIRKYIADMAQSKRNIILVSQKSFDKFIIAGYIKSQLRKTSVRLIEDIDSRMEDLNGRINILPGPDIQTIVKVMEQIIYGCQSFILGINLGTYDNIINKLKVLIALNYKNLTPVDITTLIGAMNAIVLYISKNEDGLFFVSGADEIVFNETKNELELSNLLNIDSIAQMNKQKTSKKETQKDEHPNDSDEQAQSCETKLDEKEENKSSEKEEQEQNVETILDLPKVQMEQVVDEKHNDEDIQNINEQPNDSDEQAQGCETKSDKTIKELENNTENNIVVENETVLDDNLFGFSESIVDTNDILKNIDGEEKKLNKYQLLKEKARKKRLEKLNATQD